MNVDEKEAGSTDETSSSKKEASENYEVGYGKPPKKTRFQKGASGNPSGRRKKARDLDAELSKELNSTISVNDNGKPRRISKVQGIIKRFINKALGGDIHAARLVLTDYKALLEREALSAAQKPSGIPEMDPNMFTDGQLAWLLAQGLSEEERKKLDTLDVK